MNKEIEIFQDFVRHKGLNRSDKREQVLKTFLKTKHHISADELYKIVRRRNLLIGHTTVYRTLKLIAASGLAQIVDFDDGVKRFERHIGREYHAHFVCSRCGHHWEVFSKDIQKLTDRLSREKKFSVRKHRFEIFGLCQHCRRPERSTKGRMYSWERIKYHCQKFEKKRKLSL